MKQLTLIRHAKSSWSEPITSDHERPLNARGERDAPRIGQALASENFRPGLIISSTALRARTTAGVIAELIGYPADQIREERRVYLASVSDLIAVVREVDENIQSLLMFGHNPGFEDFCNALVPGRPIAHMPTCAVAQMTLNVDYWGAIDAGCAELVAFRYPKQLAE